MAQTFAYRVRDRAGQIVSGSLEAENPTLVANKLREMGYVPITIARRQAMSFGAEFHMPGLGSRVKLKEIAVFSRQFSTMINAGLTLLRSLSILAAQTDNHYFSGVIDSVRVDVESGSSLSQALTRHPKQFNRLYVAMVRAGESGGALDRTLDELSSTIEKQVELRGKIRSALAYPIAVLCLVACILAAMLIFIIPIFKKMYTELGGTLPAMTRGLIAISNVAVKGLPVVIVLGIIGVVVFKKWVATEKGRARWDAFKLRIPVMGTLARKISLARFASSLSTLLSSGVPVLESLEITAETVGNSVVAKGVRAIAEGAKRGEPFTKPLEDHPVFPPMITQMMAVGEETGALDDLLRKVAMFFEQEVESMVSALTALLEPLLIVVLGSAVGGMVVALYLPMFDIIKLVGNNK
ncbi:MAG TPA: type II secretion system F family protein [Acidimicrobiales bacterium]|jgi:type IV pilus assembly protein PilC|nr:type II secretion system F family protein [Acidimicrobiales bacterium]